MASSNTPLLILLIFLKTRSITSTKSLDLKIDRIADLYIREEMRNNQTLYAQVRNSIKNPLLEKHYLDTELIRTDEILSNKSQEYEIQMKAIDTKLDLYNRALPNYEASALIEAIETDLEYCKPDLCVRCLEWGHLNTTCTNEIPKIIGTNRDAQEEIHVRKNYWHWILQHRRNYTEIANLSKYLEELYDTSNLTDLLKSKPITYEEFELQFCYGLAQIRHEVRYMVSLFNYPTYWSRTGSMSGHSEFTLETFAEHFLKACGRRVDHGRGNAEQITSTKGTTATPTMNPLELEVNQTLRTYIGKDILRNNTLLRQVREAVRYALYHLHDVRRRLSEKEEAVKRTDEMSKTTLALKKNQAKTLTIELCTHKCGEKLRTIDEELRRSPLSSNSSHPTVTFDKGDSIAEDLTKRIEYWHRWLQQNCTLMNKTDFIEDTDPFILPSIERIYYDENFTSQWKPKPESLAQFKSMFSEALGRIDQYVRYLWSPHEYINRPLAKDQRLHGVPLHKYAVMFLRTCQKSDVVIVDYDE